MADIAQARFKRGGIRYMPGQEVPGLKAADRKELVEAGLVKEEIREADVKAAKAFQRRVDTAGANVEKAQAAVEAADEAVKAADDEKKLKAAEAKLLAARENLTKAEAALQVLQGD